MLFAALLLKFKYIEKLLVPYKSLSNIVPGKHTTGLDMVCLVLATSDAPRTVVYVAVAGRSLLAIK
jgi:hypothetical protein